VGERRTLVQAQIPGKAQSNLPAIRLLFDGVVDRSPGSNQLQEALVRALGRTRPEGAELTVLLRDGRDESFQHDGVSVVRVPALAGGWPGRLRWHNSQLPKLVQAHEANVVYSLSGLLSRALAKRCGTITCVNNMLPFTPASLQNYEVFSKQRLRYFLLRKLFTHSLKLADAVLLHSTHALELLSQHVEGLRDKTVVVHSGIPVSLDFDADAPPAHPYEGKPYLFYLSALYRYKNHETLIRAHAHARQQDASIPELLIAGFPSSPDALAHMEALLDELGMGQARYLGVLPRADIAAWLHHATVNVFPSTCETNSVVLAEILGCDGVLACADIAPMPEIVGDAAALFDPYDIEGLSRLLTNLAADPEQQAELKGLAGERKKTFSWDACGEAIWQTADRAARAHAIRAGLAG